MKVKEGQIYVGWGKRWQVTRVHPEGVVDAVNTQDPRNTIRWPLTQFKQNTERWPLAGR